MNPLKRGRMDDDDMDQRGTFESWVVMIDNWEVDRGGFEKRQ